MTNELVGIIGDETKDGYGVEAIPDYCHSLVTTYELEERLSEEKKDVYVINLTNILGESHYLFKLLHASADARARAWLMTMGSEEE